MTRKTFTDGQILFAEDVNQIGYPVVDGQDILGHGAKVSDSFLDDAPDQIKSRFYAWYDRFKVSLSTGLNVNISNGLVNAGGTVINIPPQVVVLPNNATRFIWIGSTPESSTVQVRVTETLPDSSIPLARVVTASGSVTSLTDLREITADFLPAAIPDAVPIGSFIASLLPPSRPVPNGYIELQDDPINVSRLVYSALFTEFGTYYGAGDGTTTFTLPGKGNRYVRLSSSSMTPGETGGSNQISIATNNLPSHSHPIVDVPHTHWVSESPHSHSGSSSPHTHVASGNPHNHSLYANTTDGGGDQRRQTDGFSKLTNVGVTGEDVGGRGYIFVNGNGIPLVSSSSVGVTVDNSTVSVNIAGATTGLSVNAANTGLTSTQNTGNGTPITHEQPYLAVRVFVKF